MLDFLEEIEAAIPALRRYAYALLGDRDESEELVRSSLERALSRRAQCRRDGSVKLWLFCVLLNRYRETLRRGRPRLQVVRDTEPTEQKKSQTWGHNSNLAFSDMREAIANLPADQRVALLLASLEGMNCEETAQLLSIPRSTILSRNVRARATLRQLTEEEEPARSAS